MLPTLNKNFDRDNYWLTVLVSVRQILRTSINQIRCALTGHDVSPTDEIRLFSIPQGGYLFVTDYYYATFFDLVSAESYPLRRLFVSSFMS